MSTCDYFTETAKHLVAYHKLYEAIADVMDDLTEDSGTREELRAGMMLIETEMEAISVFSVDFFLTPHDAIKGRQSRLIDALVFDASFKFGPGASPALHTEMDGNTPTEIVVTKNDEIVFSVIELVEGETSLFAALEAWQFADYVQEVEILFGILEVELTEELRKAMDFSNALALPHLPPGALSEPDPAGIALSGNCPNTLDCFDLALDRLQEYLKTDHGLGSEVMFGASGKDGAMQVRTFTSFSWCTGEYSGLSLLFRFDDREEFIVRVYEELCSTDPFGLVSAQKVEAADGNPFDFVNPKKVT